MDDGLQLGKYWLKRKLAVGGMAEIWLAEQRGPGGFAKELVVKRILPHLATDARFVEMFLDEARLAAQLHHPNIVQIYDLGEVDGSYYIAMEFIRGHDLEQILNQALSAGSPVDPGITARIVADACGALDYAHRFTDGEGRHLNLVHRDVSPQNILVGSQGVVTLVDFGVAKAATSAHKTQTGAVKGKFAYMSPEQIGGKPLDGRSDLFAMGIVLFELLTGRRPFGHENELMAVTAIMHHPAPRPSEQNPAVDAVLDQIVLRSLEKDPDQRFGSAEEMQTALEHYLHESRRLVGAKDVRDYVARLFGEPLPASGPIAAGSGVKPPPPPRPPSAATVNLHLKETQRVPPAHAAPTGQMGPTGATAPRSRGIGAGLVLALIIVFVALGGGGYFLYTTLTGNSGGGEGTGSIAAGTPDAAPPEPDAGSTVASSDAGTAIVTGPPDAGPAVEPDAAVAVTTDAGPVATTDAAPLLDAVAVVPGIEDAGAAPPDTALPGLDDAGSVIAVLPDAELPQTQDAGPVSTPDASVAVVDAGPAGDATVIATADAAPADVPSPAPDAGQVAVVNDAGTPAAADATTSPTADVAVASADTAPSPDAAIAVTPDAPSPTEEEPTVVAEADTGGGQEEEEDEEEDEEEEDEDGGRTATIRVRVSPPGRYEVLIDGVVVGRTPVPAQEVSAGAHEVSVRRVGGDETLTERVRVRAGRTETVRFNFD